MRHSSAGPSTLNWRTRASPRDALLLAGILGPAAFIAAWTVAGALTAGYSSVDEAISRLAAVGAPNRPLMTAGFVGFGLGIGVYALALRRHLRGPAWAALAGSGAATLGVALFPLGKSSAVDVVHNLAAGLGYLSLAAVPLLAARPLCETGHGRAALVSVAAAGLAGACLAATLLGPLHGLLQRAGLTVLDAWLMASALALARSNRRSPTAPSQAQRPARS